MALFDFLLKACNIAASLAIVALMGLIATDVIGRAAFNHPLTGVPEIVKLAIVAIVWLQFAFTLRSNQHLRSNLIFGMLPRGARRAVYAANCALGIAVFALIAKFGFGNAVDSYASGIFEGEHPMRIPVWPVWAIITLGAALMTLEYLRQGISALLGHPSDVIDDLGGGAAALANRGAR